jgi:pyruvate formate lyase activating enzyme
MYDTAKLANKKKINSVMITGGFIEQEPLVDLLNHLAAVKVDLKSIREDYYRDIVDAKLKPVLDGLVEIKKSGVWLEIVYLVVPTLNDTDQEFKDLAKWLNANLGSDVPIHYSRFHPQYLLKNLPPTPRQTLERAYDISRAEGLNFVYLGNLPGHPAESTRCPKCNEMLIERRGYRILKNVIKEGKCPVCSRVIPGIF